MRHPGHTLDESFDACNGGNDKLTKEMHLARYHWAIKRVSERFTGSRPTIIDAASGRGYGTKLLSQVGNVIGMDICEDALKYAKAKYDGNGIKFCRVNLEEGLNVPPSSVDVIVSFETLEHLKNPRSALSNFYKSLNERGSVFVSVPNGLNEGRYTDGTSTNPYHIQMYTQGDIGKLMEQAGFSGIRFLGQAQIFGLMMRYLRRLESSKVHDGSAPPQLKQSPLRTIKRKIFGVPQLCDLLTRPRPQLIPTSDVILVEANK